MQLMDLIEFVPFHFGVYRLSFLPELEFPLTDQAHNYWAEVILIDHVCFWASKAAIQSWKQWRTFSWTCWLGNSFGWLGLISPVLTMIQEIHEEQTCALKGSSDDFDLMGCLQFIIKVKVKNDRLHSEYLVWQQRKVYIRHLSRWVTGSWSHISQGKPLQDAKIP